MLKVSCGMEFRSMGSSVARWALLVLETTELVDASENNCFGSTARLRVV